MFRALLLLCVGFALPVSAAPEIKILLPKKPNGCLLIYAHGYRPEGFPNPATLDSPAYQALHESGWIIASTSYRKTGMVVAEGAEDVDQLRDKIEKKYGPIRRCLLHGESMGGTIVALLAQRDPKRYQGAIAVGAALQILPPNLHWVTPKIPLLFLTNQSELAEPQKYLADFRKTGANLALWKVARDGHVNVNGPELLAAVKAVDAAIDGKKLTDRDGTIAPKPGPSDLVKIQDGFQTTIDTVDPVYGNFIVRVRPADLKKLTIKPGGHFLVVSGREIRKVLWGKDFNDVPEGDWVAFGTADGWLRIVMNFRNAAKNLGVKSGDKIELRSR